MKFDSPRDYSLSPSGRHVPPSGVVLCKHCKFFESDPTLLMKACISEGYCHFYPPGCGRADSVQLRPTTGNNWCPQGEFVSEEAEKDCKEELLAFRKFVADRDAADLEE